MREAQLRPSSAELYPGIGAGQWRTAATLADQVLAGQLLQGVAAAVRGRVLPEVHFDFRGGITTGGERKGVRPQKREGSMTLRMTLAEIFRAAGKAHHRAFAATNGDDPRWPEWYAQDLAPTLSAFLGSELRLDALTADLKTVDADLRARAPLADWTLYYADWFLTRHVA